MVSATLEDVVAKIGLAVAESEMRYAKHSEEMKRELTEAIKSLKESDKVIKELIGNLGGKLGVIIEMLVIPGICSLMNKHGHDFVRISPNVKLNKDKTHTQVDLMLYNTTEAMAVEIKTQLDVEDVDWHINNRLRKLLELQKEFGIEDKALYGAVAGISIDYRARKRALDNGLYVIEIRENEKIPLTLDEPENLCDWKMTGGCIGSKSQKP